MPGLGAQHVEHFRVLRFLGTDDHARNGGAGVVLGEKGIEHGGERVLVHLAHLGGKVGLVAQVTTAADHGQVQADMTIGLFDGDDVGIGVGVDLHRLLVLHARQGTDAVAQHGRLLEAQFPGGLLHLGLHLFEDFLVPPFQEGDGGVDITPVVFLVDQPHAGRAAAANLVQQAGARTVGEVAVLAGAQVKDLLQQLDALAHGKGAGIGAEELRTPVRTAPVVRDLWKRMGAELEEGIGLVVPEQDVEAGLQRLDQVVFQQQGLGLGADGGGVDLHHARDHLRGARAGQIPAEVRAHPLAQVTRLAHVEHGATGVLHAVDAGQCGERAQKELQVGRAFQQRRRNRRCGRIGGWRSTGHVRHRGRFTGTAALRYTGGVRCAGNARRAGSLRGASGIWLMRDCRGDSSVRFCRGRNIVHARKLTPSPAGAARRGGAAGAGWPAVPGWPAARRPGRDGCRPAPCRSRPSALPWRVP